MRGAKSKWKSRHLHCKNTNKTQLYLKFKRLKQRATYRQKRTALSLFTKEGCVLDIASKPYIAGRFKTKLPTNRRKTRFVGSCIIS